MGVGMGIIIVKTLQSHSPRPPIAPLRGPTHTRPGNLDLFFMKNCGVRGLSSHTGVMMKQFCPLEHGRKQEWIAEKIAGLRGIVEPIARAIHACRPRKSALP